MPRYHTDDLFYFLQQGGELLVAVGAMYPPTTRLESASPVSVERLVSASESMLPDTCEQEPTE